MILRVIVAGVVFACAGVASASNPDVEKDFQTAVVEDGEIVIQDEGEFEPSLQGGEDFFDEEVETGDTEAAIYVYPRYYYYVTNGYGYQDCHNRVFAKGWAYSHAVATTTYSLQLVTNGYYSYYAYVPYTTYACYGAR